MVNSFDKDLKLGSVEMEDSNSLFHCGLMKPQTLEHWQGDKKQAECKRLFAGLYPVEASLQKISMVRKWRVLDKNLYEPAVVTLVRFESGI